MALDSGTGIPVYAAKGGKSANSEKKARAGQKGEDK
jgi:hypothetical protein